MAAKKPDLVSMEYFGDIAILRIEMDILLVDRDTERLYSTTSSTRLARTVRVIIDLTKVHLLSSVGLSRLTRIRRQLSVRGGQLILCNMAPKVSESFRTSNLDRFFSIEASLEKALAALRWSLEVECPIAGCDGTSLSHEPSITVQGGVLRCRSCGCQFWVAAFQFSANGEARAEVLWFVNPTYEQEQIRVNFGVIVVLEVVGRLDLFTSEAMVDAWRSLPQSCRGMLDLRAATELSEPGLCLVAEHVGTHTAHDRIVVLVDQVRFSRTRAIISNIRVTTDHDEAMSTLRGSLVSGESPTPLVVLARKVDTTME